MSQVYGLRNEPKDVNAGGFWKNLAGKLSLPFEKYASDNTKKAEQDKEAMLPGGSFTAIGTVKPKELRMVAGGTEVTVKTYATQTKELEGCLNKIISSLKYVDGFFEKNAVTLTNEEKVKDVRNYIEASEALKEAKDKVKEATKTLETLEPKLMEYFKASNAEEKILEIEEGFVRLGEKPVRATPSYKSVVEEIKKKLSQFNTLIDKLVKKHTPSGTTPTIEVGRKEGQGIGRMIKKALSSAEEDGVRDIINEAVNELKMANNLVQFLLDESVSAEFPVEGQMESEVPPVGQMEPAPAMATAPTPMTASSKYSLFKKADGTQGTWDIDNYKNIDKCRDCAFFQSDPAGTHLNKCHDCVHYKLNGTIDYYKPRSGQIVTDSPTYKAPETKPAGGKKAFVGTIGMPKSAKKPKVEEPIKTQDESLESKLAKKKKEKEEEPIKSQTEGLESRFSFKGTLGIKKKAGPIGDDGADENGEGTHSPVADTEPKEVGPEGGKEKQLEMGRVVEKEHTATLEELISDAENGQLKPLEYYIEGIAEDHIEEIGNYYTLLKEMEDKAKAETGFQAPTPK
jgi:hypothetical protein